MEQEELKKKLSPMEYAVTQENATERPFSGKYDDFYKKVFMLMLLVVNLYSLLATSMMPAVDGQPLAVQSKNVEWLRKLIFLTACTE